MYTFPENQDIVLTVPLTRDGETFVPDNNSVFWEVRDHTGAIITPKTPIAFPINVTIPASEVMISAGREFEKRTVTFSGTVGGRPFSQQETLRISKWLNISAKPSDVRNFIGIDDGELPDRDVDLFAAYYLLADRAGVSTLEAALTSGTHLELRANEAVVAQAVIACLPSLQARVSKTTQDGTNSITRFDINFDAIRSAAEAQLDSSLNVLGNRDTASRVGFIIGLARTDPVTG